MTAHDWMQHIARAAEDGECHHDAFMCRACFYAMAERAFEQAQREARAEAFEEAARLCETFGFMCREAVIDAIRALAKVPK